MTDADDSRLPDQALLERDAAIVDLGAWEVVSASGNDRVGFLHRVLTGRMEGVPPGQGGRAMLLTTKGHPVADILFFVRDEELRLVLPPGQGEPTATALGRYAIMDDFVARPLPDLRLVAIQGTRAVDRLRAAGVPVPPELDPVVAFAHAEVAGPEGPLWLARVRACGADGLWVFGSDVAVLALRARLEGAGVETLAGERAEALRILAGEPKFGVEITPDNFPMEVGRTSAIDYGKGCFLGQEPIVRIRDRGHINWRLVGLRFAEAATVLAAGDRLESDSKPKAGRLTSVARLTDGRTVGLGLLHVSIPAGSEARVRHGEEVAGRAQVVELPEPPDPFATPAKAAK